MRYVFVFLVLIHGLIHLMGFVKAFKFAEISQLPQPISRLSGIFWLIASLLFLTSALMLFLQKEPWWMLAAPAVVLSQGLVFSSWKDARVGTIANIIILVAVVLGFGAWNYFNAYQKEVKTALKQAVVAPSTLLTENDLQTLPAPVQQYLRFSGAVGKPKVSHFKVEFDGQIRKNEQSAWMPFYSEQYNFMDSATRLFFMKATMKHLPVAGFHSFHNGEAFMDIRLLSLFRVQYQTGPEMGIAETVTFFNDMCCMAPATLIDKRVQWLETDGNKVKASFSNHGITISAWLFFDDRGALVNFISDDRYAASDDGVMKKLRWATPLKDYKDMRGQKVAGYAETIYTYPDRDLCYGQFRTTNIEYNCE